jgi:hypothetical protein
MKPMKKFLPPFIFPKLTQPPDTECMGISINMRWNRCNNIKPAHPRNPAKIKRHNQTFQTFDNEYILQDLFHQFCLKQLYIKATLFILLGWRISFLKSQDRR